MKKILLALTLAAASLNVSAAHYDGNTLIRIYNKQAADKNVISIHSSFINAYITGIADSEQGKTSCVPDNFPPFQLNPVIEKYLRANPAQWDDSGVSLVRLALAQSFPCRKP